MSASLLLEAPNETAVQDRLLTPEEFFDLPKEGRFELIEGKVIELPPVGFEHGDIAISLAAPLRQYVRANNLGRVVAEVGFVLGRSEAGKNIVRAPDVAFLSYQTVPATIRPRKFIEGAPDIAVEINSPGDLWSEVEAKALMYFGAGAREVWIVDPPTQSLSLRRPDGTARIFGLDDVFAASTVLPGFELPISALFE